MPANQPSLQYVTINDFRPGIQSNVRVPSLSGAAVMSTQPGFASEQTSGCVATQTGELAPLPLKQTVTSLSLPFFNTLLDPTGLWRPVGFGCAGPVPDPNFGSVYGFDELHLAVSGIPPSLGSQTLQFQYEATPLTPLISYSGPSVTYTGTPGHVPDATRASVVLSSWGMTWEYTRALNANFTNPGRPTSFADWAEVRVQILSGGPSGLKKGFIFPDPTNVGANAFYIQNPPGGPIHYFTHDARILALNDSQYAHGGYVVTTNELISYGDPPGNFQLTVGNIVLDPNEPTGYGAWGSISYGELLLIKRSGGAILVSGDIYSPQITRMPGVMSTGNLLQKASKSAAGLVYCVDQDGAYAWNGGNTSQKISTISDNFHVRANGNSTWGITTQTCVWGPYVVFANGWIYDTLNGSWWNLDNSVGQSAVGMVCSSVSNPRLLYTVHDMYFGVNGITPDFYDLGVSRSNYQWVGQPIPVSPRQQIDIREVTLTVASPIPTNMNCSVDMVDLTGAPIPVFSLTNQTLQSNQPQSFRMPCSTRTWNISPQIIMSATNGTDPAPNVISLTIGYLPAFPVGQGG